MSDPLPAHSAEPLPCPDHIKGRAVFRHGDNEEIYVKYAPHNITPGDFIGACGDVW